MCIRDRDLTIWIGVWIGQTGEHWLRVRWKFWRRGRGYVRVRSFEAGECRLLVGREFRRRSRWIPLISRAEVHRNYPFDALPEAIEMLKHPVASNCLGGASRLCISTPPSSQDALWVG